MSNSALYPPVLHVSRAACLHLWLWNHLWCLILTYYSQQAIDFDSQRLYQMIIAFFSYRLNEYLLLLYQKKAYRSTVYAWAVTVSVHLSRSGWFYWAGKEWKM